MGGVIPTQLFVLLPVIAAFAWWLHRTSYGRSLYAIGYSAEGARYAGIPVARRLGFVYVLSGLAASLAAVIYVAHLGQAKSDAGTGYELMAITAVVLGGASIFGGRGTVLGTMLGLFGIVILQNGLRLSAQPAELAGILTGVLLVATILLDRLMSDKLKFVVDLRNRFFPRENDKLKFIGQSAEENEVKNSQVAILSAVILLAGLIVAGSNWWLVRSLRQQLADSGGPQRTTRRRSRRAQTRDRDDAESERRSLFHQLPPGRRRSGEGVGRRAVVGWPNRSRSGKAE